MAAAALLLVVTMLPSLIAGAAQAQCGIGWRQAAASGPGGYEICYDEERQRTVLFSGTTTHEWDGTNWTTVAVDGPPERGAGAMVYDPIGRRCLLFGGYSSQGARKDLWSWDGSTWTQLASAPAPAAGRGDFAMAFDRGRNRLVVHGGWPGTGSILTDTLEYDPTSNTWQRWATGPIGNRYAHRMAYDEARGEIILHGGFYFSNRNDTWRWNGSTWTAAGTTGPARYVFGMTYDSRRQQLILHGGTTCCSEVEHPQTYVWNGTAWSLCPMQGPARGYMNVAYDRMRDVIVLPGGMGPTPSGRAYVPETWELAMSEQPRTLLVPDQYPTIQAAIAAAADGDTVLVAPGDYVESVSLQGKAIEVRSQKPRAASVLAPDGQRSFVVSSGESSATRIVGFHVGRSGATGGGIATSGTSPVVEDCTFDRCINASGAGALVSGGQPSFVRCEFVECVATYSGGELYSSGGALRNIGGNVTMTDCVFDRCVGRGNAHVVMQEGGSILVDGARCTGAAYPGTNFYNAYGSMTIEDSQFSSLQGPAIFGWAPWTVRRTSFVDVTGHRVMETRFGTTTIDGCSFRRCQVDGYLFGVVYSGVYTLANSEFCDYSQPVFQGGWTDLGGNTFTRDCVCIEDLDGNGVVDAIDLATLLMGWGTPSGDLTGDGNTDGSDLSVLLSAWGPCG